MKANGISELRRRLYGKHRVIAFFDAFRLKLLYKYAFENCSDVETDQLVDEIISIEDSTYSEYSDSNKFSFFDIVRNSSCFFNPDMKLRIDMFGYISLEMAFLKYKSGHCFLLASYKHDELNECLSSSSYDKLYNNIYNTRDIVSNAFLDLAYAEGGTSMKSENLTKRIYDFKNDKIIVQ